jgi:hypothetical protein
MVARRILLLAALLLCAAPSCARKTEPPPKDKNAGNKTDKDKDGNGASSTDARKSSYKNLSQIGRAFHNHAGANNNCVPANAIYSKDRKPLLSWRVAVLPYLEQAALYKEFKLDEPWDSEHNKKLLAKMPSVYAPVKGKTGTPYSTYYQVFVGKDTGFDPAKVKVGPTSLGTDLTIAFAAKGASDTLLVAEGAQPVPWTKPEDIPFDPKKPLPKVGGQFSEGFFALLFNAEVKFIAKEISDKQLRALITTRSDNVPDWKKIPLVEQPPKPVRK